MYQKTNHGWLPFWGYQDEESPALVYFRKKFNLLNKPEMAEIKISADTRYKLYVNDRFVQEGPQKGDLDEWHYDEADLVPYLREGTNCIAVEVLRYPEEHQKRNHSLHRGPLPFLFVDGAVWTGKISECFDMKSGWKCYKAVTVVFRREPFWTAPLCILEDAEGDGRVNGWKMPGYDDSKWDKVKNYTNFELGGALGQKFLSARTIPYQRHQERMFTSVICVREGAETDEIRQNWQDMLVGKNVLEIPAGTRQIVEITAGELMTGYLQLEVIEGAGSRITMHCAESYSYDAPEQIGDAPVHPVKGDRTDYINGRLQGTEDTYRVNGCGTEKMTEIYEPFWFRTFRYIRLTIETKDIPLKLYGFRYRETGYPLDIKTMAKASDKDFAAIWDICERTLRRCMHETYIDCPFYEQLQYAMDSRTQILYTYVTAADDRLARRCMEDLKRTRRADGMINCCAPTCEANVIPGFSIFYILMVYDHMMYFGDKELVRDHFPTIDGILRFFESNLNEKGLIDKLGGPIMQQPYWSFVDWAESWSETAGVPCATLQGPITMESLLYIMGLQRAADLAAYISREGIAEEYKKRAEAVKSAILKNCTGYRRLIQDGPGVEEYSVHSQIFAILTDVVTLEDGRRMLEETLGNPEYAQCSVAMSFYLFRALQKTNLYEKTERLWDTWRQMLEKNLTTCMENNTDERSDCHAWGALLLYELPAVILGVQPGAPGYETIRIEPAYGYLKEAEGDCITPKGMVHVSWYKDEQGNYQLSYQLPD